ncbi:hypothetical protein ABFS82_08G192900 [Erythranthe guttata]
MAPPNPTPPSPSASAASNSDASNTSTSSSSSLPPLSLTSIAAAAAAASSSNQLNCLWIHFLIALCKEVTTCTAADADSTTEALLLPNKAVDSHAVSRVPRPIPKLKFTPVIGILSHPGNGGSGSSNKATKASYIAASYVKFVESAGARVIPLIYNEPLKVINEKLNLVNGVIFTGGTAKSGVYFDVVKSIFKSVLRRNDAGEHFPLLAICLGFELITMIVSEKKNILETFDAKNHASTLKIMGNIDVKETLFQSFPPDLLKKLSKERLVMQNHRYGISPKKFVKNDKLRGFFNILTITEDRKKQLYVSTVQAHKYPVTGVQWHPEKNAYDQSLSATPRSKDAVKVTKYVANFFVREARMSKNKPSSPKVQANLIRNWRQTIRGNPGKEVYIFS